MLTFRSCIILYLSVLWSASSFSLLDDAVEVDESRLSEGWRRMREIGTLFVATVYLMNNVLSSIK